MSTVYEPTLPRSGVAESRVLNSTFKPSVLRGAPPRRAVAVRSRACQIALGGRVRGEQAEQVLHALDDEMKGDSQIREFSATMG